MSIKNTSSVSISKLLEDNNSKTQFFVIPKYQRAYTWSRSEWAALYNDVLENGKDYFLGSIICVCDDSVSSDFPELEIIDGQQRMTTISILLAVLHEYALPYSEDLKNSDDDLYDIFRRLKKQLAFKKNGISSSRLSPQVQGHNREDFQYVLSITKIIDEIPKPNSFAKRKIYHAYKFFKDQIGLQIAEEKEKDAQFDECAFIFDLIEKFNSAILVNIEVTSNKDAYMLFESLNNRGVPLSAIDLIKNHLIRISDKDKKDAVTYTEWESVLSKLTDEYSIQERFFRQFYNAFRNELNLPFKDFMKSNRVKYYLGPLATRTTMLGIFEKLIEKDYSRLLTRLKKESKNYAILINNSDECPAKLKNAFIQLDRIQGAPSYILLLYLLSYRDELALNDEMIEQIVELLIKFFVRRNVTDFPGTRNLNKIFMETVDKISGKKAVDVYNTIHEKLVSESSTDEIFDVKLRGKIYEENVDAVRFLLCYYEESFFTKENKRNLWERDDKKKYIFTIEHVFPEGENIPKHWVDMIAGGDKDLADQYYDKYVHTLGNLTLTGFNSNLSNKPFEEKKNLKDKNGHEAGYKNGLKLNDDIVSRQSWSVEYIADRTSKLVDFYKMKFKL